jgi:hypothetical protein
MLDNSSSLQHSAARYPSNGNEKRGEKVKGRLIRPARELETLLAIIRFAHHAPCGQPPAPKSDRAELPSTSLTCRG